MEVKTDINVFLLLSHKILVFVEKIRYYDYCLDERCPILYAP